MSPQDTVTRRSACKVLGSTIAVGGLAGCLSSSGGNWPSDPINFVVPMDAGGGNDPYARAMTSGLSDELGVDVSVVNQPPPSQRYSELLNQDTDGQHITIHNATPFVQMVLDKGFDIALNLNSWYQLGAPNMSSLAMAMSLSSEANSWDEAVRMSKEDGTEWNAAVTPGGDLTYRLIAEASGINFNMVGGYAGSGEIFADMQRGNIDFYFSPAQSQISRIRDGIAKPVIVGEFDALADRVSTVYEEEGYTDVPSLADLGMDNVVPISVFIRGVVVSPEVPEDRRETLRDAVWTTIQSDDYISAAEEQELVVDPTSPEEQTQYAQDLEDALRTIQENM